MARKQIVRTAPKRVLVGEYLTNKGKRLLKEGADKGEVNKKYLKNRYKDNPKSKQLKEIKHTV